jgi:hypothetical protein
MLARNVGYRSKTTNSTKVTQRSTRRIQSISGTARFRSDEHSWGISLHCTARNSIEASVPPRDHIQTYSIPSNTIQSIEKFNRNTFLSHLPLSSQLHHPKSSLSHPPSRRHLHRRPSTEIIPIFPPLLALLQNSGCSNHR